MIGVTSFIKMFKESFDRDKVAKKISKDTGRTVDDILGEWEEKQNTGIEIHKVKQREFENTLSNCFTYERTDGSFIPTEKDSKLLPGVYLERPIWTLRHGLIGYPDRIDVIKNKVYVEDYKTWETVRYSSPVEKIKSKPTKKKFFPPIDKLDDCNYKEASLQLSLYMRIILDNNPNLIFGGLNIRHISIVNGVISTETMIKAPYLRTEVDDLLRYKKIKKIC